MLLEKIEPTRTFYDVPLSVYQEGVRELRNQKVYNKAQCIIFVKISPNKYKFINPGTEVCFNPLKYLRDTNGEFLFMVTRGPKSLWKLRKKVSVKSFSSWLVNESIWSEPHLVKDEKYIEEWGYHIDCHIPNNYMLQCAITTRHTWEWTEKVENWNNLVNYHGFDPLVAWLFLYQCVKTESGSFLNQNWSSAHNAFCSTASWVYYKNMLSGSRINPERNYSEVKSYKNVDILWGFVKYSSEMECLLFDFCITEQEKLEFVSNKENSDALKRKRILNPWLFFTEKLKSANKIEEIKPENLTVLGGLLLKEITGHDK